MRHLLYGCVVLIGIVSVGMASGARDLWAAPADGATGQTVPSRTPTPGGGPVIVVPTTTARPTQPTVAPQLTLAATLTATPATRMTAAPATTAPAPTAAKAPPAVTPAVRSTASATAARSTSPGAAPGSAVPPTGTATASAEPTATARNTPLSLPTVAQRPAIVSPSALPAVQPTEPTPAAAQGGSLSALLIFGLGVIAIGVVVVIGTIRRG